jgi:hypothetical protein
MCTCSVLLGPKTSCYVNISLRHHSRSNTRLRKEKGEWLVIRVSVGTKCHHQVPRNVPANPGSTRGGQGRKPGAFRLGHLV